MSNYQVESQGNYGLVIDQVRLDATGRAIITTLNPTKDSLTIEIGNLSDTLHLIAKLVEIAEKQYPHRIK